MKYLLPIFILILVGCGKQQKELRIDPALQPYFDSFLREAAARGRPLTVDDLVMELGDAHSSGAIGICYQGERTYLSGFNKVTKKTPRVVIDRNHFYNPNYQDSAYKVDLIYHELGHCLLNLDHDLRKNTYCVSNGSGCAGGTVTLPESIMYPESVAMTLGSSTWNTYKFNYLEQLFGIRALAFQDNPGLIQIASKIPTSPTYAIEANQTQENVYVSTIHGCNHHVEIKTQGEDHEASN